MKIFKIIGIIGGWAFLIWCLCLLSSYLAAQQQARQNAYAISILEQVREPLVYPDCWNETGPIMTIAQINQCAIPQETPSTAAINDRVDQIEQQYNQTSTICGLIPCNQQYP